MTINGRSSRGITTAVVLTGLITLGFAASAAAESVKLTGCLVRGEGDGYMLINPPVEPAASTVTRAVEPGALGTSGAYANIFYWLGDHGDLRDHVGHQVEIEGDPEGDIKAGELKVDRKAQWTEIDIRSGGRRIKAQVPNASVVAGPEPDRKMDVLVRRIDVDKIRMIAAACR